MLRINFARLGTDELSSFTFTVSSIDSFLEIIKFQQEVKLLRIYPLTNTIIINCSTLTFQKLLSSDVVQWADQQQKPVEELMLGFVDYSANNISAIQNAFPNLNGDNIVLSVKEQMFDTADIDFKGRIIPSAYSAASISSHASLIATITSGGGNAWYNTKGAAWKSKISSASFLNLLPEPNSYYQTPILVQNHSYGTIIESYYGAEAAAYDASVIANPLVVHLFSAGNSGSSFATTGTYANINGYANLTGNFKQAKNIITVGHTDSTDVVLSPSSKGPAFDGRIKPELVAFGEDGSSGATALVSGVAAVLHHTYRNLNNNTNAQASLIKAVLLNSAEDVDAVGIDYKSGYGKLNATNAVRTLLQTHYFNETIADKQQKQFTITVPTGIKKLKVTLVWTDPAAQPGTVKALVNDLDLELKHVASGSLFLPWVLNPTPSVTTIEELPVRKKDTLNVVEQITLDNPTAGDYQFFVKGSSIPQGAQAFSIAYQLDTLNKFAWYFPTSSDYLFSANSHILRFQSSYANNTGAIEYSLDKGITWQNITQSADLQKGYYKWITPNVYSEALLAFTVNGTRYISDTFTISKRLLPAVGFNCADSVLLTWPKINEASSYRITSLGTNYMEQIRIVTDTSFLFSKASSPSKYYSITPLLRNNAAMPSYTFNYETQGTDCYVKTFLAELTVNNSVLLSFVLGTDYMVQKIRFEKLSATGFIPLNEQNLQNSLQFIFNDQFLINGSNAYRVAITLVDGRVLYSNTGTVYFTSPKTITVYPNPVRLNEPLQVLSNTRDEYIFQLFDLSGKLVLSEKLKSFPQLINIQKLQKGFYIYRATGNSGHTASGKLILH
ncbi:S8 family peptidase [Lacibacter luteus]|uniref:S8 family peptidase n=1 Tax=Lacibacter luteus TaxID=2508719 RepID=UPI0013E93D79|nr:S8 family peptidase [Lacibacter luteus]